MAAVLATTGLGWTAVDGTPAALAKHMAVASGTGAALYAAVLFAAWFLSGRPRGAEADLLELLRRSGGSLHHMLQRRKLMRAALSDGHSG